MKKIIPTEQSNNEFRKERKNIKKQEKLDKVLFYFNDKSKEIDATCEYYHELFLENFNSNNDLKNLISDALIDIKTQQKKCKTLYKKNMTVEEKEYFSKQFEKLYTIFESHSEMIEGNVIISKM